MNVSVYAAYSHAKASDLQGKTVVVIDVLRATSTIVTALKNGCRQVAPVLTPEDAVKIRKSNGGEDTILGGERKALKISGFDYGNSPLEYVPFDVKGKSLILCTTNGTRAILACKQASAILIGAFINVSAVAKKAAEYGNDIAVVCAGTKERFSIDDILAAGAFIDRLIGDGVKVEPDDLGLIARKLYKNGKKDLKAALSGSKHYEYLLSLGLSEDIDFCLTEDSADIVPEYSEGFVTVAK
jgi:2-phosphosulfolactate phosphatase